MNICIYGASSAQIDKKYLDISYELGQLIAQRGHTLYFGGGNTGVMGAAAEGAFSQGGKIVGVAPSFFDTEGVLYPKVTKMIFTETMAGRKQYLEARSDAFIAMPGGIGTYDEFFECITNKQLGLHDKPGTVLNAFGYYDLLKDLLEHTISERFMAESCRALCGFFGDCATLMDDLEDQ